MDREYDLAKSKMKLGALVPILQDSHGNVIDGFHRMQVDPHWPTIQLDHIKDKLQLTIARLVANVCRREMTTEEKTLLLTEIAEATGWSPADIANATGMSYNWVAKYLPSKYKDKYMQEIRSHVTQRVTQPEVKEFKPKETWEQRKAVMQPQHSRMEEAIFQKLHEKGLHPVVDHEFCLQSTTPDLFFVDKNLAIYLDGEVHEGKEERDDQLRELLTKRYGVRVVSIKYDTFSKQETERVLNELLEVIRT